MSPAFGAASNFAFLLGHLKSFCVTLNFFEAALIEFKCIHSPVIAAKKPLSVLATCLCVGGGGGRDLMFKLLQPSSFSALFQSHLDAPVGRT